MRGKKAVAAHSQQPLPHESSLKARIPKRPDKAHLQGHPLGQATNTQSNLPPRTQQSLAKTRHGKMMFFRKNERLSSKIGMIIFLMCNLR